MTGGARGIGLAVVDALVEAGAAVVATHLTTVPPDRAGVTWVRVDVTDPSALDALVADHGPFAVIVANAATLRDRTTAGMTDDDFSTVIDTDLGGAARVVRRALPAMVDAGWGRIVAITSAGALLGSAGQANYAVAKAALNGWVGGLAVEVARQGITVNAVAPGPIDTELLRDLSPRRLEGLRSVVPAGRLGLPSEVAALVRFLVSDEAGFVTGTVIPIDGGLSRGGLWGRSVREHMLRAKPDPTDA